MGSSTAAAALPTHTHTLAVAVAMANGSGSSSQGERLQASRRKTNSDRRRVEFESPRPLSPLAAGACRYAPPARLHSFSATSPAASPVSLLHRLLSAAAPAAATSSAFAVQQYLVDTGGLTPAQAFKASTKLTHLKSPSKPAAVLAFLAGLGLSSAEVAALIAKDPQFLCAGVDSLLAPNVAGFTGLGLSQTDIARLVSLAPVSFRCRSCVSNLPYYLSIFGSYEIVLRVIKCADSLLSYDLERVVRPNVAFLRECGLGVCDIAKLCISVPWLLEAKPARIQAMVACSEGIGVPRGSGMFRHALHAVRFSSKENIAARVDYLKKTLRWSDAEVGIAVSKYPFLLFKSNEALQHRSEFLINEMGLEPAYIAHWPTMFSLSLEGRLKPRYYAVKFLKENGLLDCERDYFSTFVVSEKVFIEKFIYRHREAAPHLAEDYAAACRGEGSTKFRST